MKSLLWILYPLYVVVLVVIVVFFPDRLPGSAVRLK